MKSLRNALIIIFALLVSSCISAKEAHIFFTIGESHRMFSIYESKHFVYAKVGNPKDPNFLKGTMTKATLKDGENIYDMVNGVYTEFEDAFPKGSLNNHLFSITNLVNLVVQAIE